MPIKSLSVVITGNATGLTTALKGASAQLTAFDRSVAAAAAGAGRLDAASAASAAALGRLDAAAATTAAALTRLDAAAATGAASLGRLDAAAVASATALARLDAAATAGAVGVERIAAGTTTASGGLARLDASVTTTAGAIARLDAASAGLASLGVAATSMGELGVASQLAATETVRLQAAATTTAAAVTRLDAAAVAAGAAILELGVASGMAAPEVAALRTASATAATAMTRLTTSATTASAATAGLGTAGAAGAAGASRLGAGAAGGAAAASRLGASSTAATAGVTRLGTAANAAGAPVGRIATGAAGATSAVSTLSSSASTAAKGGVLVLGVALAAAAVGAVQFEASMRNVASIDAQVEQNFAAVSQSVLNMAKTVPQSANTLAEGLYNIAGSGFYGADAMHILETSATAASAGLTDTNTASKAIVASLNAYGMSASEAGRVSDALFSTVNYGVISFEALTGAVANSVGNAAKAGISIEELGAALATMTLSGMTASNAGVSLNNMISKLVKPSKALSSAAQELGINLQQDLANPAIGLHGVMEKLRVASEGNVTTLLKWFPEIRAARGAMALMAADGDSYKRVIKEMGTEQKTAGETARVFAVQAQSVHHQLQLLGNQVAVTGIELGTKMLPYLEKAVTGLTSFGATVKDIGGQIGTAARPGVDALVGSIKSLAEVVQNTHIDTLAAGLAKLGVGTAVTGFNALATVLGTTTGLLASNTTAVEALVAAWLLFKTEAIVRGIQLIAVTIASTLVNALVAGIAAIDTMIARLTVMGGGNLWRGMAAGALAFGGALAVATAGIGILVAELKRISDAKADIKNAQLSIDDILGQAPGGAASAIGQVADKIEEVGPKSQKSFEQARAELAKMTEEARKSLAVWDTKSAGIFSADYWTEGNWKDAWKIWERPGREADKYREILGKLGEAQAQLDARQELYRGNLTALANVYGITEATVASLADKYGIDLVTSLDAAGASGESARWQFQEIAGSLVGADASAQQAGAGLAALDIAAGGADQAVKDLNTTLAVLAGNGISAQQAADAVATSINDIAANTRGAQTATGGYTQTLTGNSAAAIANRAEILNAMSAAMQHAEAVTKLTGDTSAGTAAFEAHKAAIIDAAVAAGRDRTEVENLIGSLNMMPATVSTDVQVPGVADRTAEVVALTAAINSIPLSRTSTITMRQQWIGAATSPTGPQDRYLASTIPRASGGPIYGPGGPTADQIPAMLSNGEWVIRANSAAQYGPKAMAAINDGRARIIVPEGYAAGGPVRPAPTRAAAAGTGAAPGSGTTGAIQQIASGAASLADVYQATTQGVIGTARALREVVPRMWRADQQSSSLAASTASADGQMGRWRDTLVDTTGRVDLHRDGLRLLGLQMGAAAVQQYPALTAAVDVQTTSRVAESAAQALHQQGLVLLGTTMDTASGTQLPALTGSTDLQTTATDLLTAAVDLGTQAYGLATEATGLDTDTRDIWTTATDLGTAATDLLTAAVDLATVATGEQTTATTTQTTATNTQTTATNTASTATTAFSGTVKQSTTDLGANAAAATTAAAAVREYAAALNAVPKQVTSTVTTNYVTTGTKQAAGFAGGGQIYGPGTGTSDSVPIMASRDEWIIRAAAARQYGTAAMSAVNAGTARIVAGSAQGFATGGLVGGYAQGGMVRGSWAPVGGGTTVNINAPVSLTIKGGDSSAATIRAAERAAQQVVDKGFGKLAAAIGARPGRGRG